MIQVTEFYVCVGDNPDGEGIVAGKIGGQWLPLIGSNRNEHLLEAMKETMRASLKAAGTSGRMLKFACREVLEEVPLDRT